MLVMVFMGVFAMVVSMLASYLLTQANVGRAKLAREQALGPREVKLEIDVARLLRRDAVRHEAAVVERLCP